MVAEKSNVCLFMGVFFSIIYVCFSIKQNILCWPALIIAAILNGYAFYLIELPLQSVMQLFFISVAVSGWKNWNKQDKNKVVVKTWNENSLELSLLEEGVGLEKLTVENAMDNRKVATWNASSGPQILE